MMDNPLRLCMKQWLTVCEENEMHHSNNPVASSMTPCAYAANRLTPFAYAASWVCIYVLVSACVVLIANGVVDSVRLIAVLIGLLIILTSVCMVTCFLRFRSELEQDLEQDQRMIQSLQQRSRRQLELKRQEQELLAEPMPDEQTVIAELVQREIDASANRNYDDALQASAHISSIKQQSIKLQALRTAEANSVARKDYKQAEKLHQAQVPIELAIKTVAKAVGVAPPDPAIPPPPYTAST